MSEAKEVALFGNREQLPAHLQQSESNLGNENVGARDTAMPRISLLQALSPQVTDGTLPEARAGMLHNSITDEVYKELFVVNLFFTREYSVFKRRELGGGYEGSHPSEEAAAAHISDIGGRLSDYEVKETAKHVVLLIDENGNVKQPAEILMSGTKLRVSSTWNAEILLKGRGLDRFATVWRLSSVKQSNSKGSWFNYDIEWVGWAPEALYNEAKKFYEAAKAAA